MSVRDDLVLVLRLACESSYRSNDEQAALLRVADRLDAGHNRMTVANADDQADPSWLPSALVDEVMGSRWLDDGNGDREVTLAKRRGAWPRPGEAA